MSLAHPIEGAERFLVVTLLGMTVKVEPMTVAVKSITDCSRNQQRLT
jgi:hypothetical protein